MIPVTFTYNSVEYSGQLKKVSGSGSDSTYHLMINSKYVGQLWKTNAGWQFATQKGYFPALASKFGNAVDIASKGE